MIADADGSPMRHNEIGVQDHTMENASQENNSDGYSMTSDDGKIQKLKENIGRFFKENTISDMLPYNLKLIVLNNEMTMCQTIEAMVHHQNVRCAIVWNHAKREYQHILTLQDILECTLYVAEKL